jgi:hypothetical protein
MSLFDILDQILHDLTGGTGDTGPALVGDPLSGSGASPAVEAITHTNPGAAAVLTSCNATLRDASDVLHTSPDDPHWSEVIDRANGRAGRMTAMLHGQNIADGIRQSVATGHQDLLDSKAAHQAVMDSNADEAHADAVATAGDRLLTSVRSLLARWT